MTVLNLAPGVTNPAYFKGVMWGLTLSNNGSDATNDIDIAVGCAVDRTQTSFMNLTSAFVKRLDASWAAGSGNGGLDTGAVGNNMYHVWLIRNPSTNAVDVLFSLSGSSPTMPSGYTQKCRIGGVKRVGGANKLFTQCGREFLYKSPIGDIDTTESTTASLRDVSVPSGIPVQWLGILLSARAAASTQTYLTCPDIDDEAAQIAAPARDSAGFVAGGATSATMVVSERVRTNSSAQIRSVSANASTTIRLTTRGWEDPLDNW